MSVVCCLLSEVELRGRRQMGNRSDVELMLLTSNSWIQGFETPSLKIAPEGLVASDVSLWSSWPVLAG